MPKPPKLKGDPDWHNRLSGLEDYLMLATQDALERAFIAGAYPDELLAALTVVYLRSCREYQTVGDTRPPVTVGHEFHRAMYVDAEVV